MKLYCEQKHHHKLLMIDPKVYPPHGNYKDSQFDGIADVCCYRHCGEKMCRCTYDVETGKVYEMYLEDMDYLLNYKYGRLNYVEFGNKYYAREDPSETIHVRTKLNIFIQDGMSIQDISKNLIKKIKALDNFK